MIKINNEQYTFITQDQIFYKIQDNLNNEYFYGHNIKADKIYSLITNRKIFVVLTLLINYLNWLGVFVGNQFVNFGNFNSYESYLSLKSFKRDFERLRELTKDSYSHSNQSYKS